MTQEIRTILDYAHDNHMRLSKCIVEVGAGDGDYLSHAQALIDDEGWWAKLIEPDPRAFAALIERYSQTDSVVCCNIAVGERYGQALLQQGRDWSVSHLEGTTSHVHAAYTEEYTVWVYPLEDILDAPLAGILSIDAEGMDTAILKMFLESDHRIPWPQFLLIEGNTTDEQTAQRILATTHGYTPIAVVEPNQIFAYRGDDR